MLLVALVITIFVTMLAMTAAHETGLRLASRRDQDQSAQALLYAQAGIENAAHLPLDVHSWRSTLGTGKWIENKGIGGGSFTVEATDPADGIIEIDGRVGSSGADTVRFAATGELSAALRGLRADYVPLPHAALRNAGYSRTTLALDGVAVEGRLRANGAVQDLGGTQVHGDITTLAGNPVSETLDDADTDIFFVSDSLSLPTVDFEWFRDAGGRISLPWHRTIRQTSITAASNPYGSPSPEGIYYIDATNGDVYFEDVAIYACIAILKVRNVVIAELSGATTYYHESPDPERLPALLVDGDLTMKIEEGGSLWFYVGGAWRPHASHISGAIFCTGTLWGPQIDALRPITVEGAFVADLLRLEGPGTLIRHDPTLNTNPLVGLHGEGLRIVPGSTREL